MKSHSASHNILKPLPSAPACHLRNLTLHVQKVT